LYIAGQFPAGQKIIAEKLLDLFFLPGDGVTNVDAHKADLVNIVNQFPEGPKIIAINLLGMYHSASIPGIERYPSSSDVKRYLLTIAGESLEGQGVIASNLPNLHNGTNDPNVHFELFNVVRRFRAGQEAVADNLVDLFKSHNNPTIRENAEIQLILLDIANKTEKGRVNLANNLVPLLDGTSVGEVKTAILSCASRFPEGQAAIAAAAADLD
jgi:hypothetical protein